MSLEIFRNSALAIVLLIAGACTDSALGQQKEPEAERPSPQAGHADEGASAAKVDEAEQPRRLTLGEQQQQLGLKVFTEPWTGDLDGMEQRRVIRVLTVYGLGRYFIDGLDEKGPTYELFTMFEDFINKRMKKGHVRVHVVFIPVARDQLLPGLIRGRGDIAAAGLTITPERDEIIDFSEPVTKPLSEILVTGPSAPDIESLEDLAGQEVHVRASSSYRESLDLLNGRFRESGLPEIEIVDASELLEDEDLLEMVNAGLYPWAVVDDYKANIWAGVFENLQVRNDLVLRSGGRVGFAFRENSPKLAAALDEFLKTHRQGTLTGNILINRYFKDFDWARNALAEEDYGRFEATEEIFRRYGEQYGFDYLMVMAQGYQESRLDQSVRSHAGAIGIMQLLPSTAADPNVGIPDITKAEPNIHAGVRYLDFIRNRYFSDPEIDHVNRTLLALAAYNAGPARVQGMRGKARDQGYDPNRWFDNVELVAAREIGRETVQYVANIYKYYIAYRLSVQRQVLRMEEREREGIE